MQKLIFFKLSEISGFQTFILDGFISSRKCSFLMVDPALSSLDSELFNTLFDVFTAFFPAALSRKKLGDPLTVYVAHSCIQFGFWVSLKYLAIFCEN